MKIELPKNCLSQLHNRHNQSWGCDDDSDISGGGGGHLDGGDGGGCQGSWRGDQGSDNVQFYKL